LKVNTCFFTETHIYYQCIITLENISTISLCVVADKNLSVTTRLLSSRFFPQNYVYYFAVKQEKYKIFWKGRTIILYTALFQIHANIHKKNDFAQVSKNFVRCRSENNC